MLNVRIICVGKLRDAYYRQAASAYEKRLRGFCRLEEIEVAEFKLSAAPSPADVQTGLRREGKDMLAKCAGMAVPLCIEGKQCSSEELADWLRQAMQLQGKISFFIGSSYGLSEEIKALGQGLSMSRMTFPHGLARVMLMEQIYRSMQILHNGKYHK